VVPIAILLVLMTPYVPHTRDDAALQVELKKLDSAERFALAFLQVVGAEQRECSAAVVDQVRSRDLKVICADFDGAFEELEKLSQTPWPEHVLTADLSPPPLSFAAETDWETTGPVRQRLYRVGESVVGVRFIPGEVLLVW
jgi:hypothetical protein